MAEWSYSYERANCRFVKPLQKKEPSFTENPSYSDIPATVTLFGRPNTVTVSGEAWTCYFLVQMKMYFLGPFFVSPACVANRGHHANLDKENSALQSNLTKE